MKFITVYNNYQLSFMNLVNLKAFRSSRHENLIVGPQSRKTVPTVARQPSKGSV